MYSKLFFDPRFWELIMDIAPGVRNIFLHILKIEKIYMPYIPVPGIRQIIYFFKSDTILAKSFDILLKEPYKHIDQLKNIYILLNYSGNLKKLRSIHELPKNYILNKAMENINDFGRISLKLNKYLGKYKTYSTFDSKKLLKQLKDLKDNESAVKEIWQEI